MTRKTELLNFLDDIYIPVYKRGEWSILRKIILENDYRTIEEADANKMYNDCLVIQTKGRGKRETFAGYLITRIDIGEVNEKYADIAYYLDSNLACPKHIARKNIKFNLPQ